MNRHKAQVRRFYEELWNRRAVALIPVLLHEDCSYRGSLGTETRGHAAFAEYLAGVHRALDEYRCEILELVAEGDRVVARMRFGGVHRGALRGFAASGRRVAWDACAWFRFAGERIADLWVLGDLQALDRQLGPDPS